MTKFTISGLKASLKNKGLYFCVLEASKYLFPIRWVKEKSLMDRIYQRRAYNYLKRKYIPLLQSFVPSTAEETAIPRIVWICWLQGEENAPELVRKCISSVREHMADYDVRVITWENIGEYANIPACIYDRLSKRQMQFAQFSDYLRACLLCAHGGIWLDSTVLLTAPLPQRYLSSPLFVLKTSAFDNEIIRNSSWLICSQKNNALLQQTKFLLDRYWEKENRFCDYYLFHLLMAAVAGYSEENRKMWMNIPFEGNANAHRLQALLFEEYSDALFDDVCIASPVHKLTYKFAKRSEAELQGTFYQRFIADNL